MKVVGLPFLSPPNTPLLPIRSNPFASNFSQQAYKGFFFPPLFFLYFLPFARGQIPCFSLLGSFNLTSLLLEMVLSSQYKETNQEVPSSRSTGAKPLFPFSRVKTNTLLFSPSCNRTTFFLTPPLEENEIATPFLFSYLVYYCPSPFFFFSFPLLETLEPPPFPFLLEWLSERILSPPFFHGV